MRTVYINENSLDGIKKYKEKLKDSVSQSIISAIENGKTVYKKNDAFPDTIDDDFLLSLVNSGFDAAKKELLNIKAIDTNKTKLGDVLGDLKSKIQDIERPVRPQLEKLCYNVIVSMFKIPQDSISFKLKLVDTIDYGEFGNVSVDKGNKTIDSDIDGDISKIKNEINKRSIITALCIGAGMHYSSNIKRYISDIYDINPQLGLLYRQFIALNNYLSYTTDDFVIDENNKGQIGLVNINICDDESIVELKTQALIFPVLLSEAIRGMMEIFASHGLPDSIEEANLILSRTDYLKAEPIYMMTGEALWNKIVPENIETVLIPYYFKRLACLKVKYFNKIVRGLLRGGYKSKEYTEKLMQFAKDDFDREPDVEYEKGKNGKAIITDDYIREDEL